GMGNQALTASPRLFKATEQTSRSAVKRIAQSMSQSGWQGEAIHAYKLKDGTFAIQSLIELIKEYLRDVDIFMSLLRQKIGDNHPLASVRNGLIPKEGSLEDIRYNFHGRGCKLEKSGRIVEFDFGSGLNHEGF